jgi:CHAT domain-containing protein/Tfp pilus assembly protein PilF
LGETQKALDHLNQALPLSRVVGDRAREAATLNSFGAVYDALGEKRKALEYLNQALPLCRAMGDRAGEAATLTNIGKVYDDLGEKQKALDYYSQALPLLRKVGDRDGVASTLNNIGAVYSDLGEKQKALEYLNQVLPLRRAVGNRDGEAVTLNNVGGVYDDLGEKQKALGYYNQALPAERAVGDRALEAATLGNIASTERNRGDLLDARTHIEAALKIIESLRTKITSQELRASYFSTVQGDFAFYIDILMRLHGQHPGEGYDRLALEASERGRARSLLETLTEARADIRQGVEPQLLDREQDLQQRLDSRSDSLVRLLSGPHTEEQAAGARKEIDNLLGQYQEVVAQIRTTSPHYAALTQPQPLTADEIQQQVVDPDTVLLEYALGPEHSYLFAVTPDSLVTYTLPKVQEIESRARDLYALLTHSSALPSDQVDEVTAQFSQVVLGPAASQLGHQRLAIVADGALNYIPLGALPAPSGGKAGVGKAPPLVVNHEIVYLPSASTLALLRRDTAKRPAAPKLLAVMADPVFSPEDDRVRTRLMASNGGAGSVGSGGVSDRHSEDIAADLLRSQLTRSVQESGLMRGGEIPRLPFTRQEADGIASLVPTSMRLEDLDFAASKAAATSDALSQYRMVHFATHGLLDSAHPELSGVVLSMVDEKGLAVDGFLRLHDIFNLNLPADLVVLSACQTGLGKEIQGEGLVGLTRGFMYAGAPRVVVSLWSVNDQATSELMVRFYKGMLVDKLRPAAALKAAQMSMWKDPRWSTPYYWAAFTLQGEWQ